MNRNLTSLSALEMGTSTAGGGGVLKVSKGFLVVLKGKAMVLIIFEGTVPNLQQVD